MSILAIVILIFCIFLSNPEALEKLIENLKQFPGKLSSWIKKMSQQFVNTANNKGAHNVNQTLSLQGFALVNLIILVLLLKTSIVILTPVLAPLLGIEVEIDDSLGNFTGAAIIALLSISFISGAVMSDLMGWSYTSVAVIEKNRGWLFVLGFITFVISFMLLLIVGLFKATSSFEVENLIGPDATNFIIANASIIIFVVLDGLLALGILIASIPLERIFSLLFCTILALSILVLIVAIGVIYIAIPIFEAIGLLVGWINRITKKLQDRVKSFDMIEDGMSKKAIGE